MKALSILSIIFSVVFFIWFVLFISSNNRIDIEEFAPIGIIFGLWTIAFSIVAIVTAYKKKI